MEERVNTDSRGISYANIDKLMMDIIDYAERSNKILNNIQLLVNDTANYFVCDSGKLYRKKFNEYFNEASTVNKNILSYNEDLMTVKKRYNSLDSEAADMMKNAVQSHRFKKDFREEK